MKNKINILLIILIFSSCQKSPLTCDFSGEKITRTIALNEFNSLEVSPLIELTIYHASENKLEITVDRDVADKVTFDISDKHLQLINHTDCVVQNSDAVAYIDLYVKDLTRLIANTDMDIHSGNIWSFDNLEIICENYTTGTNNIADFDLQVNIDRMSIIANGSSIFRISGTCQNLFVGFYGLNPSIRGEDLIAGKIHIFQRSNADMHLYPVEEISGDLYGYGDVYLYHRPPVVNIVKHYAGHIYFVD